MIRKKRLPIAHLIVFGWMPSFLKGLAYRLLLGYRIGKGVKFSFGGVVVGRNVDLGDYAEIGLLAVVIGRSIKIGRYSSVGTMSYVSCERIEIGEDARIREQVYVGGPQLPESAFVLGNRTIVLQMAFINPTMPVTIGDDTGIGGHCLIFTHGAWLNVLDGYPVNYEPVTLGKSVWLPWRVFVMPGTTIGDGSVIGANSLVSGAIPANSLAVGSPAKVIKSAPDFPKKVSEDDRKRLIDDMLEGFERYVLYEGAACVTEGSHRTFQTQDGAWRFFTRRVPGPLPVMTAGDTILTDVALTSIERLDLIRRGIFWLDLRGRTRSDRGSPLTEELASFISRYGIRLPRALS
jgi:acetyltransferase-like isoleucine patch superfamily enzyme